MNTWPISKLVTTCYVLIYRPSERKETLGVGVQLSPPVPGIPLPPSTQQKSRRDAYTSRRAQTKTLGKQSSDNGKLSPIEKDDTGL